ncbi:hypothetical protein ACHAXR_007038 [Thalassiosira sp. AJA248-18]
MIFSALLPALLLLTRHQVNAARSLSARRVQGTPTRAADKYDRSITTFSPEGRLLQLEYALIAAEERGRGLTVCVECDGVVVFAFPSTSDGDGWNSSTESMPDLQSPTAIHEEDENKNENDEPRTKLSPATTQMFSTNTEHNPTHNTKVHRLSPTHLLLTSGLAGDSRTLASAFRRLVSSWTHINYGEVVTARELAKEMSKVRHSIGLRPGARVLGVIGMLIGLDDVDDEMAAVNDSVEVRMYRSLPGGTMDRCNVCCTGGGADALGNAARKDAMDILLSVVSQPMNDDDNNPLSAEELRVKKGEKLQRVIEEAGQVVLKYHPDLKAKEESLDGAVHSNGIKKMLAVDIWVMSAAPAVPAKKKEHSVAFVSPHRHLGKTLMETRYVRRVALDQLSIAADCLVHKNAKI